MPRRRASILDGRQILDGFWETLRTKGIGKIEQDGHTADLSDFRIIKRVGEI